MRYKLVYDDLRRVFRDDPDVLFLVEAVASGSHDARKQLADTVLADKRQARRISMTSRAALRLWVGQ